MTHSVKVELPRAASAPTPEKPLTLQVSIDADNAIFVGSEAVDRNSLESRFRDAVARDANVEMHLKADRSTRYESVAETMSAARRAGSDEDRFRHATRKHATELIRIFHNQTRASQPQ